MPVSSCAFYCIIKMLDAFPKYVCGSMHLDLCGNKNYAFWNWYLLKLRKMRGGEYKLDWKDSTEHEIMFISVKQHSEYRVCFCLKLCDKVYALYIIIKCFTRFPLKKNGNFSGAFVPFFTKQRHILKLWHFLHAVPTNQRTKMFFRVPVNTVFRLLKLQSCISLALLH